MAGDSGFQQLSFDFDTDSSVESARSSVADNYRRLAERGDAEAQFQLAQLHRFGAAGVPESFVEARVWFQASAANGHPTARRSGAAVEERIPPDEMEVAEFRIGELYLDGTYAPQDCEAALAWFRRAAARGHPGAQTSLGKMYRDGTACNVSSVRAYAWFCVARRQISADAGRLADELQERMTDDQVFSAWLELGEMHRNGTEVPRDAEEALYWYRMASEEGLAEAEYAIGDMYRNGEGVSADDRQALKWYLKAASRGFAKAQFEVGEMYLHAEGTPRRRAAGYAWLSLAAMQGLEQAALSKTDAESTLTDMELQRARTLSNEFSARIVTRKERDSKP